MNKFYPSKHCLDIKESQNRRIIHLESELCSLGRDANNLIRLNSSKISRHHATLIRLKISGTYSYQFRIIDGNLKGIPSKNGLKVNGKACFSRDLKDGDVITFCEDITAAYYITPILLNDQQKKNFTKKVNVNIDEDMFLALNFITKTQGLSKAEYIRKALLELLNQDLDLERRASARTRFN